MLYACRKMTLSVPLPSNGFNLFRIVQCLTTMWLSFLTLSCDSKVSNMESFRNKESVVKQQLLYDLQHNPGWPGRLPSECYATRQTAKAWQQAPSPASKKRTEGRKSYCAAAVLHRQGSFSRCQMFGLTTTVCWVLRTAYLVFLLRKYSAHASSLLKAASWVLYRPEVSNNPAHAAK